MNSVSPETLPGPTSVAESEPITLAEVQIAAERIKDVVNRTPVQPNRLLGELTGSPVWLKLENLQRAGSFKVRGAYNRMAKLTAAEKSRGVVAASAGNHAQGVALAASKLGISSLIFMPADAPLPKIEATLGYGAQVRLIGSSVDEALTYAKAEALETGRTLIHPFDHRDIIAGQGTVALEILEQVPDVATVLVPVGGGGLIAGIASVFAEAAPHVKVVGVQAANAAAFPDSLAAHKPIPHKLGATIADGIAVGTPGVVPLEILSRLEVEVRTVSEGAMARALLALIERSKLVVEPSGAAGVAALLTDHQGLEGPIVVVLSGGNIDPLLLMRVIRRGMVEGSRFGQLRVKVDDRPGSLARLVGIAAATGANVVDVRHSRMDTKLGIFDAMVLLEIEAKGPTHHAEIVTALAEAGFSVS
jgi:threonine dehydratase